jgi:16S rRNA (cytosine967-C5)-methyltransferase
VVFLKNALATAIEALSWMSYAGLGERTALFKAAEQIGVDDRNDLRYAHRLIMEVTRNQNRLEYLIDGYLPKFTEELPHGLGSFLKILAFLKWVDSADEKVLRRTVFAARQILGWKELHAYEDAISRIVSAPQISYQQADDEYQRIALATCNPEWLLKKLEVSFGRTFALRVLQRNMTGLSTYVRLNPLMNANSSDLADQLQKLGSSKMDFGEVWKLSGASQLNQLSRHISNGEIVVQDLASIVASLIASPKPGDTVLDVCAAPGNKTTHLAALMENNGRIYSLDISAKRLKHWKQEVKQKGVKIATPTLGDAANIPFNCDADIVLLDPPCSNTGVFARNPLLKWKASESKIRLYVKRQRAILREGSNRVRSNGVMIYCTCSILPEENESLIEEFLEKNPEFELENQSPFIGEPGLRGLGKCQRFYPHIHDCNGYFIARLRRIN